MNKIIVVFFNNKMLTKWNGIDWAIDQIMNCNFKQSNTSATHVCVCVYQQYTMYNSITSIIIIILTVNSAGDTQLDTVTNTGSVGRVAIGQSLMVRE